MCDGSAVALAAYVGCSLARARASGMPLSPTQPLILFTDEQDAARLVELRHALAAVVPGAVVHGDAHVRKLSAGSDPAAAPDEPFVFAVSLLLRVGAALDLRSDRTNCSPCDSPSVARPSHSFGDALLSEQFGVTAAATAYSLRPTPWHSLGDLQDPACSS